MKSIFQQRAKQAQMDTQGYTTFDLLHEEMCSSLQNFYQAHHYARNDRGIGTELRQPDNKNSIKIARYIANTLRPFMDTYFHDFQIIDATFIIKDHGTHNLTPMHQDWTYVDERNHNSYTLWCPLQDMELDNSTLGLLPGSHRIFGKNPRPSPSPPYAPVCGERMLELFGYMDFVPLKAGQAILFDHRTLHGAMPNTSSQVPLAIGINLTHKDAKLQHHYMLPGSRKVGVYEVDSNFYSIYGNKQLIHLHKERKELPDYPCVDTYTFRASNISGSQLLEQVKRTRKPNPQVASTLQMLFPSAQKLSPIPAVAAIEDTAHTKPALSVYTPTNTSLDKHQSQHDSTTSAKESTPKATPQKDMAQAVAAFYDAHHESFMETYGTVMQAFRTTQIDTLLNYELESIGIQTQEVVLDAGCGVCGPAMYFSQHAAPRQIHAITISDRQYRQAYHTLTAMNTTQIQLYHGDFHKLQTFFKQDTFDKIYFLESFGHSAQKTRLLAACWEVLKPGGSVYIKDLFRRITPKTLSQQRIDALISRINAGYCYSVGELNEVLHTARQLGYIIEWVKTLDIDLIHFEGLNISKHFQELTGINHTQHRDNYIFPVDFMELRLYKPIHAAQVEKDKYSLQKQLHNNTEKPAMSYV